MMPVDVKSLANRIRQELREDKDYCIAITGAYEGIGKSTLGIQLGMEIDHKFNLERNELFQPTHQEVKTKIDKLPRYSCIIADEAIRILFKQEWQTKNQLYINKVYILSRAKNQCSVFCMPRIMDFNKLFREHKLHLWLHIFARGYAMIVKRVENPFHEDSWRMKENMKIVDSIMFRERNTSLNENIVDKLVRSRKSLNIVGIIQFDKLQEELFIKYKELKGQHQFEGLDEELGIKEDTGTDQRNMLLWMFHKVLGIPAKEIASLINVSVAIVYSGVHRIEPTVGEDQLAKYADILLTKGLLFYSIKKKLKKSGYKISKEALDALSQECDRLQKCSGTNANEAEKVDQNLEDAIDITEGST